MHLLLASSASLLKGVEVTAGDPVKFLESQNLSRTVFIKESGATAENLIKSLDI
jgi:hypothetical protein